MLDIDHRATEFAKCLFDFLVERTNVMSHYFFCQHSHCPVILGVTLGYCIADPATGWSPTIRVYIQPINATAAIYFSPPLHRAGHCVACGVILASLEQFGFRVVAINNASRSLAALS